MLTTSFTRPLGIKVLLRMKKQMGMIVHHTLQLAIAVIAFNYAKCSVGSVRKQRIDLWVLPH